MTRKDVNIQADGMSAQEVYEYVRDNASQEWYTMLSNTNFTKMQGYANSLDNATVKADLQFFLTRWGNFKKLPDTTMTIADDIVAGNAQLPRTIVNTTTDYGRDEDGNPIIINNNPE